MQYVVTLHREIYQLQETKIIIDVPENPEKLDGMEPKEFAEDQALQLAEGNVEGLGNDLEEFEDEHGNIGRSEVAAKALNNVVWYDIEEKSADVKGAPPFVISVRKFKPSGDNKATNWTQ